jgi:hypothetical protein
LPDPVKLELNHIRDANKQLLDTKKQPKTYDEIQNILDKRSLSSDSTENKMYKALILELYPDLQ